MDPLAPEEALSSASISPRSSAFADKATSQAHGQRDPLVASSDSPLPWVEDLSQQEVRKPLGKQVFFVQTRVMTAFCVLADASVDGKTSPLSLRLGSLQTTVFKDNDSRCGYDSRRGYRVFCKHRESSLFFPMGGEGPRLQDQISRNSLN